MNKTVYILGAGFSRPANAPLQSEIINDILKLKGFAFDQRDQFIRNYLDDFEKFLEQDLFISKDKFRNIALEDIFTPIDRCILDGISFRSYYNRELVELREKIYSLIIAAIMERIIFRGNSKSYIDDFANYLVRTMRPRMENIDHDPVSIISTNWDILLDNSLKKAIENDNNNGVVDYCCYISSLHDDDTIKPGLQALGEGKYNVKLLKLHGSMNWLSCPKCQRLYVAFYEKIAIDGLYSNKNCVHCNKNYSKQGGSTNILRSNLIMPTFLKDLTNFQIKLIWQNASIELSEADKIVFIGYSLPNADYELRQLLSRMVRHDAIIEVVTEEETDTETKKSNEETYNRYKTFFGKRDVRLESIGVKKYIQKIIKNPAE
ncbi:MAG: hypothetical protein A2W91_17285 [Bacteroidetes bacterium GWF2_38_335]|nr:MAG: hypothetical protein A2W91_17285 [Bacteroidetes bacterium GWF2_38_335]OFY79563.1 MAG: hypothetical protein A2281_14120 [Bacteroidetes bacterium RIFOXYA12_FULL_38_20]HBS87331.1 hypothetical protein [Bacteroidales bacterium]